MFTKFSRTKVYLNTEIDVNTFVTNFYKLGTVEKG